MKQKYIHLIAACGCLANGSAEANAAIEDVTDKYITNYNFTGDKSVWNIEQNAFNTDQRVNCQEFWSGDISNAWFKMGQTLKGLPKGVYRLCINGFTRATGSETSQTAIYATTADKEYMTPIWLRHMDSSYGSEPNSMDDASKAFYNNNGNYWLNTIDNIVVTDGEMTIGARNTGQMRNDGGAWTILGNVKLYRLNGTDLQPMMSNTLQLAEALAGEGRYSGIEELEKAISEAESIEAENLSLENIESLSAAIYNYRTARMADATENNGLDVTHLIKNAGFEDGAVFRTGTANGNYNEPKGWKLSYGDIHINNNSGMASENIEQAGANVRVTPTEGDWAYSSRMKWSNSSVIMLEQEVELEAGSYSIKADIATLNGENNPVFKVEGNEGVLYEAAAGNSSFEEYSSDMFTLNTKQKVKISFTLSQNGTSNAIAAIDNIRLTYWGKENIVDSEAAQGKIGELNIILDDFVNNYNNKVMQKELWNSLVNMVEQAELVKDKDNVTLEEVETAIIGVQNSMNAAVGSIEAYGLLENNIAMMKALGFEELNSAIINAESVYLAATADNEGIKAAVKELQDAYINIIAQSGNIVDVTSFISNAGFEEGHHSFPNNYMNVFEPYGWNAVFEASNYGDSYKHMLCIPYDNTYDNVTPVRPEENSAGQENSDSGDKLLYMRNNWGGSTNMQITQDITLPEGKYRISADINHLSGNPSEKLVYIKSGNNENISLWPSSMNTWENVSREFEVKSGETVTLSIGFRSEGGNNLIALMADNFKLELLGISYIADYNNVMDIAERTLQLIDKDVFADIYDELKNAMDTDVSAGTEEVYNNAVDNIQKALEWAEPASKINTANGDATALIKNPNAEEGTNYWTTENVGTRNNESYKGITDNYFDGGNWSANAWTAFMEQDIKLPEGFYSLEVVSRAEYGVNYKISVDSNEKTLKANSASEGNVWEYASDDSAERQVNENTGYGWNRQVIGFRVEDNKVCRLRIEASANEQYKWFSVDDIRLSFVKNYGGVKDNNNHLYAEGAVNADEIMAAINEETRSVDLRNAKVIIGDLTLPEKANRNCVVYAPLGTMAETGNIISDGICLNLVLADRYPFNNPEGFLARQASYSRESYMDGLYETLVIPFDSEYPEGDFVWEDIDEENIDYVTTAVSDDSYIQAGKAYLMRYTGETNENTTEQVYNGENAYIEAFAAPVPEGLFGSYDRFYVTDENENIFMLSAKDGAFRKALTGSFSAPFRACYRPADNAVENYINIHNNTTGIKETDNDDERPVDVYSIDGLLIKKQVKAKNALDDLKQGIYIVDKKKILVK